MTARRNGHRCAFCGRRCRYAREVCSTCRSFFGSAVAGLRELPARRVS